MRVIERKMIAAMSARKPTNIGNTTVATAEAANEVLVYLYGNHIATIHADYMRVTMAGWVTPTTASRVNAILSEFARGYARVFRCKGNAYMITAQSAAGRENEATRELRDDEWIELTPKVWC